MFGEIRTMTNEKGETFFVGKDVAKALGYKNTSKAIQQHVDQEDKTTLSIWESGSNYKTRAIFINESGLYSLILSSKLEKARLFKRWVTSEVLPQIRKTGGYIPTHDAEVTGKPHNDVLKAIRKMEQAWVKVTEGKFSLSAYKESSGRTLPCYSLTKTECLYIATKFNDEARAKLVIRWQQLEQERLMHQGVRHLLVTDQDVIHEAEIIIGHRLISVFSW